MKILIIGNGGSGKSTLANKLGADLDIAVTHLDLLTWEDNYVRVPEEIFLKNLQKAMENTPRIIEGWSYQSTMRARLEWADDIIYLKYPLDFCLENVFKRNETFNNRAYPYDAFTGDRVERNDLYREAVERVHFQYEPAVQSWLQEPELARKNIFTLTSMDELNRRYAEILAYFKSKTSS